ncbi:trypsin-4-like [Venturia canescens]|uniref:trypsin-4-like n=1 Tax=Venturia canescens TaxID=32260 RepID=UPI001C9C8E06|nr:trypsin-4-like [Venturia canescens]XP_043287787.1 trypsin-4-like [Venturia canescens]
MTYSSLWMAEDSRQVSSGYKCLSKKSASDERVNGSTKMALFFILLSSVTVFCQLLHPSMAHKRVVDGSVIDIEHVPFMLSFRLNGEHICGAAIISDSWGLTAAHCIPIAHCNSQNYSVRSGSEYLDKGGRVEDITVIAVHESYDPLSQAYDIAAFRVERPFKRSSTTKPIALPGKTDVPDDWGVIAGWGYYSKRAVLSEKLEFAVVPKVDRMQCADDYEGRYSVTPTDVCYGYRKGGEDACKGDSGGPLFSSSNILLGITSWGDGCGQPRSPGVYTTIFLVLDWITEKTGVTSTH